MRTMHTDTYAWNPNLSRWALGLAAFGLLNLTSVAQTSAPAAAAATPAPAAAATTPATAAAPAAAAAKPYGKKADKNFWDRLGEAEIEQLGTPVFVPATPPPP